MRAIIIFYLFLIIICLILCSCGTSKPTVIYFEKDTTLAYKIKDSSDCGQ